MNKELDDIKKISTLIIKKQKKLNGLTNEEVINYANELINEISDLYVELNYYKNKCIKGSDF